ncbi:hypothetical protein Poli38472_014639 [Pythium oligandrum]|uniref:non-specific serine/threonine protein kinase n=1 Tax=Pythium oligandrum TaxID=41045 RepID=A0A8K1CJ08_PYTOL|nr:hypothetical protein Poli38472_014639 [Pythium oligandrum]|eukprot:TMW63934.1 hypothetical protein Poli38472_014639 [Pythium oligandrum]
MRSIWLVLVAFVVALVAVNAADCQTPNTLVLGSSNEEAIAFDEVCNPRLFRVRQESAVDVSLNLSHLNLERVQSYPRVYTMLLGDNKLTTFQTATADNDMEELDLSDNSITDLVQMRFPRRLTSLDLSGNNITDMPENIPWPEAKQLKTLVLDGNPFKTLTANTFAALEALKELSLASTRLGTLQGLSLPTSLTSLDLSNNQLVAETLLFAEPLTNLKSLDLSYNKVKKLPSDLTALQSLSTLILSNNALTVIKGVRFPAKLQNLNLADNAITSIEIARSDVALLTNLVDLQISVEGIQATCSNEDATPQVVREIPVCVLDDDDFDDLYPPVKATTAPKPAPAPTTTAPTSEPSPKTDETNVPNTDTNANSATSPSTGTSNSAILIGAGCFGMGLLVAVFIFIVRKERRRMNHKPSAFLTPFGGGGLEYRGARSGTHGDGIVLEDDDDQGNWVFDSPRKMRAFTHHLNTIPEPIPVLEEDDSKRRGRSKYEDLLVYEIPLDELTIQEAIYQKNGGAEVIYRGDYQGYQVVMHALHRSKATKKKIEREYVEQVRLAAGLDHSSIVHFIGVTFGSSNHNQYKWKMGVVFEFMHHGSLTAVFQEERMRRDGEQYVRDVKKRRASAAAEDLSSWYPGPRDSTIPDDSTAPWRSKIAVALDVAMGLVYLHSLSLVHGDLSSDKVLINENGEAKLSAMDIDMDLSTNHSNSGVGRATTTINNNRGMDFRQSARVAKTKMITLLSASFSLSNASSSLDSNMDSDSSVSGDTEASDIYANLSPEALRAMQGDVYAFGLFLWELDTMMTVDAVKQMAAMMPDCGEEHLLLSFSVDCPNEIQILARRCWHLDPHQRPTALDLQEELVQLLEACLMVSQRSAPYPWSRRTRSSAASQASSFTFSSDRSVSMVISETEV